MMRRWGAGILLAMAAACADRGIDASRPETGVHLVGGHLAFGALALGMDLAAAETAAKQPLVLVPVESETCPGLETKARIGATPIQMSFRDAAGQRILQGILVPLGSNLRLDDVVATLQRQVKSLMLGPVDPLGTPETRKALLSLRSDPSEMVLVSTSALTPPVGLWINRGCVD